MNILNKTKIPILVLLYSLCFQRQPFRFLSYFAAAGVKCRLAAVKRLPVLHSADYIVCIFIFISREISCSAKFIKKEFAIVSNLRIISRTNFMLS